jgi:hypothetical protein
VGWLEETKGGGREEKIDVKIHHIFVGTRQNKTH